MGSAIVTPPRAVETTARPNNASSIQDEARLFRSNVGAIKMITRNEVSRQCFAEYLKKIGKLEYLTSYQDLEEIKMLSEDQMVSRTAALIWRYKVLYESVRILGAKSSADDMTYLVWESLGKLRQIDIQSIQKAQLLTYISLTQNELLSRMIIPFEGFMNSSMYKSWQSIQMEQERSRRSAHSPTSVNRSPSGSNRETVSGTYPDVLIVDDSNLVLKITGKTLERDGHHVDKATNGQLALQLMKSRQYDVVLIDINMPVMDGFETVRLFRDFERNNVPQYFSSDISDLSEAESESGAVESPQPSHKMLPVELGNFKPRQTNMTEVSHEHDSDKDKFTSLEDVAKNELSNNPLDTAQQGKNKNALFHQLIIGMSSSVDEETRDKALACGMDYFLPKPFTLQKFVEFIKQSRDESVTVTRSAGNDVMSL